MWERVIKWAMAAVGAIALVLAAFVRRRPPSLDRPIKDAHEADAKRVQAQLDNIERRRREAIELTKQAMKDFERGPIGKSDAWDLVERAKKRDA